MAQRPSPEAVRRQAAAAWLADARADLASARVLSAHRDEQAAPFAAAFHAEQAVEKALKALLVWHAVDYPPKHDLGLLQGLLPAGLGTTSLDVGGLTVYAVELRHVAGASSPMDLLDRPGWDEADQAVELAGQAIAVIADDLAAGGWGP